MRQIKDQPLHNPWSGGDLPDGRALRELGEIMVELFGEERRHFAAQQSSGRYRVVRNTWSAQDVVGHLRGEATMAVYPVGREPSGTGLARWLCHDLDGGADSLEEMDELLRVYGALGLGKAVVGEFSGRRGFHVWVFTERLAAGLVRRLGRHVMEVAELTDVELFPKQSRLQAGAIGNPVKLPLGIHRVTGKRCVLARGAEEPVSMGESAGVLRELMAGRLSGDDIARVVPPVKPADCSVDQSGSSYVRRLRHFAESQRACVRLAERGVASGRRHDAALLLLASYRARGLTREEASERLIDVDGRNDPPLARDEGPRWAETKARYVYGRPRFEISCFWSVIQEAGWCTNECPLYGVMYDKQDG